ncbi:hypothetical protein GCM10011446_20390 [Acinetobacter vivianii]|nr:hypothetical protein GCM10011446_20390 [Acinetobacter vivianii]
MFYSSDPNYQNEDFKTTRLSSTELKIEEVKMIEDLYLIKFIIRYTQTLAKLSNKNAEVQK